MKSGTIIGAALFGSVIAGLPFVLGAASGLDDLAARVPTPFQLKAHPSTNVDMIEATDGSTIEHFLHPDQSGLDLITVGKTYGGAYVRETTWPSLVGPFQAEDEYVCGYGLYLGAGLFDTAGAGAGLQRLFRDRIARQFPYQTEVQGIVVSLPPVASSDLSVALGDGQVRLTVAIHLVDSTLLEVAFPVRVVMKNQMPFVERIRESDLAIRFEGPSRDHIVQQAREQGAGIGALGGGALGCFAGPFGCLLGAIFGGAAGDSAGEKEASAQIPKKAEWIAAAKVDEALADLTLGMEHFREPFRPIRTRPRDEIRLRLEADPTVTPSGISLPLCVQVSIETPKVNSDIPGAVSFGSRRLVHGQDGTSAPRLGLSMNADAVNQMVHYLWQAGLLRELGQSSLVLDSLAREVRTAAFDFTGLDPTLPPTLMPSGIDSGNALPFIFGNVQLGVMGNRTVLGHAVVALGATQERDSIVLEGSVHKIWLNCSARSDGLGVTLTPCLSDLVPTVRSIANEEKDAATRPLIRFLGADLLGKLPQLGFQGMKLELSHLRVVTSGSPPQVDLSVQGRLD